MRWAGTRSSRSAHFHSPSPFTLLRRKADWLCMRCRCHLGKTILYDTVGQLGWSTGTGAHGIKAVIDDVLSKPWPFKVDADVGEENRGREVPLPKEEEDCEVGRFVLLEPRRGSSFVVARCILSTITSSSKVHRQPVSSFPHYHNQILTRPSRGLDLTQPPC